MTGTDAHPPLPLDAIRRLAGLPPDDAPTLGGGYSHVVVGIDRSHVLRFARPDRAVRLRHEASILRTIHASRETGPVRNRLPRVVAEIEGDALPSAGGRRPGSPLTGPAPRDWSGYRRARLRSPEYAALTGPAPRDWSGWHGLVIPRFHGTNAFRAWLGADEARRSGWVAQAVGILREVHRIRGGTYVAGWFDTRHEAAGHDWRATYRHYLDDLSARLSTADLGGARPLVTAATRAAFDRLDSLAYVAGPVMGHGDFHLHNVVVDGDLVTGIIDWEWAGPTEPDADLAHLLRWAAFPAHPADEDLEASVSASDFAIVAPAAWEAYPEVAGTPDLEARHLVYQVSHDLHALTRDPRSAQATTRLAAWLDGRLASLMPGAATSPSGTGAT